MRRRGFMLIDIVIGVVVMSATFGLMITLSISMTDHLARLRRARDIDAFAIGVLEGVIAGEEAPDVVAGGGELATPETWKEIPFTTRARLEAVRESDNLVRVAVVVTMDRGKALPSVTRFETIVTTEQWKRTGLRVEDAK